MIKEIGRQDGIVVANTQFLFPDYSLEDHWNEGKVMAEIENGRYDFVVAQQGPSALPESQVLLLEYASRFADVCKRNNTKMAMYMVWPSKSRLFDLDGVITSYTNAAQKTGSLLCPAGLAWRYAWEIDSTMALYSGDNFHPSVTGSVLSAMTIYAALTGKKDFNFIRYNDCPWKKEVSEGGMGILMEAALESLYKK